MIRGAQTSVARRPAGALSFGAFPVPRCSFTLSSRPRGSPRARPHAPKDRLVMAHAREQRPDDGALSGEGVSLFDTDTTQVVIRCLTARAVQRVLLSLQEVDGWAAKWLNGYCANHPPLGGDEFIAGLMLEAPAALVDPYTGGVHHVHPARLAAGVLAARQELAGHVAAALPGAVAAGSVGVLRRHLEEHTYVSGSAEAPPRASFRTYRAPQRAGKWQRLARGE
ncbi:MAG: hypothetical protein J3K34DRAFT_459013 [Monoraphidium minutum]|nr:MAG: hypothetical protein J3K34DRAFT_459013 [Monoraphidium minutum]